MKAKQVIVMRKDLNMRKGKMVAQGAHASLGAVLHMQVQAQLAPDVRPKWWAPMQEWLEGTFTKVCVSVSSDEELLRIRDLAAEAELPVKLITDNGLTEFHGVPTRTCLAIGPAWDEDIDQVTGHLPLL